MGIRIGEEEGEQHFVGAGPIPGIRLFGSNAACSIWEWKSVGLRSRVELAYLVQRIVLWGQTFVKSKGFKPIGCRLGKRHDLHIQRPAWIIAPFDRFDRSRR